MSIRKVRRSTGKSAVARAKHARNTAYRGRRHNRFSDALGDVPEYIKIRLSRVGLVTLLNRGDGTFKVVDLDDEVGPKTTYLKIPQVLRPKVKPIYAHFYLGDADGLLAMTTTQAMIDYLADIGYGTVKILDVEQGSLWAKIVAYWNGEGGQQSREVEKQKAGEAYQYAEQWAKDAFVNTQMADVTAKNTNSVTLLLDSIRDQDEAVLHVGNLLVLKVAGKVVAKDLSVPEMAALQKHSGILKDPSKALEMLALVVSGGGMADQASVSPAP